MKRAYFLTLHKQAHGDHTITSFGRESIPNKPNYVMPLLVGPDLHFIPVKLRVTRSRNPQRHFQGYFGTLTSLASLQKSTFSYIALGKYVEIFARADNSCSSECFGRQCPRQRWRILNYTRHLNYTKFR